MTRHQPPLGVLGWLVLSFAAVFFTTVAVWTGHGMVVSCVRAHQLRNAVPVEATIHKFEVVEQTEAPDTVYVTYSYEYENQRYEHRTQKLAVFDLGHEVRHAAKEALRTGETMPCYVDPDQPSLSVFSREFSIPLFLVSMLFPVFFGGASVMLVVSLFLRYRQMRRQTKK